MKVLARILLFIFIAFLSTPAIVQAIKKCNSATMSISLSEEEVHKELKSVVHPAILEHEVLMPVYIEKKTIISENIVKLDNISPSIFAPPPNLV
jgi:D-aminopeptidase